MSLVIRAGEGRTIKTSIIEKDSCGKKSARSLVNTEELTYKFPNLDGTRELKWRLHDTAFVTAQVDVTNNRITFVDHGYPAGRVINFNTTGTLPAGLLPATDYYVLLVDEDKFKLSLTLGGAAITLTSATGTGTHEIAGGELEVISPAQLGEVNWTYTPEDTADMLLGDKQPVPFTIKDTGAPPRKGVGLHVDIKDDDDE